ncbi:MAG: hypothetical protein ABIP34_02450 [Rhodoferax sp.]
MPLTTRHSHRAQRVGPCMAARFQSFTLARIRRDAYSRQSGCSRLTPP